MLKMKLKLINFILLITDLSDAALFHSVDSPTVPSASLSTELLHRPLGELELLRLSVNCRWCSIVLHGGDLSESRIP